MFFTWVARRRYSRPCSSAQSRGGRRVQVALRLAAEAASTVLASSRGPTHHSASTPSAATGAPPVAPSPVTMLTTPAGSPTSTQISAKASAVSGVNSAGLRTTVFPAASAGAIFHASVSSGKLHAMIWPQTPTGL